MKAPEAAPRWRLRPLLGIVLLIGYGCALRVDAPCTADDDCRAESEVCIDGRCSIEPCDDGEQRACEAMEALGCIGVRVCEDGAFGACIGPDETCDGVDNDCDGAVDEDFADLGDRCERGRGACLGVGVVVCDADTGSTMCDTPVRLGEPERCDAADNDCDGRVDEEVEVRPCETGQPGPCAMGASVCLGGMVECRPSVTPQAEVCDGVDNDCDGTTDDVEGAGAACASGVGICAAEGTRVCDLDQGELVCDADAGSPTDEVCNGVDDDCDGEIDDVVGAGAPCAVGVGACRATGSVVCDLDELACDAVAGAPGLELCGNRVDDDCDGLIDDPFGCIAGCGNGRRELDETCDDGNQIDGDGCSAACAVEDGFDCLDGPADVPVFIDGARDCAEWQPVETPDWLGGYGVAYTGGAIALSIEDPRYAAAYTVRTTGPDGPIELMVGAEDGQMLDAATPDDAEQSLVDTFHPLAPGAYEVVFPDVTCADNRGRIDLEFRTLDDCRRVCDVDTDCLHLGHLCVDGRCLPPPPACGDGARGVDEACDDGNLIDGDGCDARCAIEPGSHCQPIDISGVVDLGDNLRLIGPNWTPWLDPRSQVIQRNNARASHYRTNVPISPQVVIRFQIEVRGFDDDFIGWAIGGGPTALSAPEQPYLLFSWKQSTQSEPGYGLGPRGLRVGRVTGRPTAEGLWQFGDDALEEIALARTVGAASYADRRPYTISLVGDTERLRVYVDGVLEFDLADVPLGDGRLGFYSYSQEATIFTLLDPLALDICTPPDAD